MKETSMTEWQQTNMKAWHFGFPAVVKWNLKFFISKGKVKGNAISNCEVEKNNSDCFSLEWQNIVVVCFSSLLLPEINVKLLFWENLKKNHRK